MCTSHDRCNTVNLLDSKFSATLPAVTTMHQALVNSTLPARQLLVICMLPADEYCLKDWSERANQPRASRRPTP